MQSSTASGLVISERAAFPRDTPNDNTPASVPPGTVGPHTVGDDVMTLPPIRPQPWAGWPTDWQTPNWWGQVQTLTDTAWGCLDLNSSLLSTMPPYLVGASSSLPVDWLNNPDPDIYTSWEEFAKQLFWDFQTGEAFVIVTSRYSNEYPARFHVVDPWLVNVEIGGDGLRRYTIGNLPVSARFHQSSSGALAPGGDLLHIRYTSRTSDAHGHGPLEAGAGRLVAANALARYATQLAASGGVPHSVLIHPQNLNSGQAADLQYAWVQARMSSMGLPAVLSGGIDFKTLSLDPERMALVDLSKWNESRIAVLLGVPPFLMGLPSGGDSLTYSNVESLFDYHWRAGLRTRARPVVAALSGWLLPRGTGLELNRDEYVKPGPLERAQTWQILIGLGVLSADEVRELERYIATPTPTLTSGVLQ